MYEAGWDSNRFGERPCNVAVGTVDRDAEVARYSDPWAKCWRIPDLDDGRGHAAIAEEYDQATRATYRWTWSIQGRGHGYPTKPFGILIAGPNGIAIEAVPGAHAGYSLHHEQ